MEDYSHTELESIMAIEDNQACFDCGSKNPKWTSLNNAIFLCLKCASFHRSLGPSVSIIRSLQIDEWNEKEILKLKRGGNARFSMFLHEYNVAPNVTLDCKYMIRASDFYRKQLQREVEMGLDSSILIPFSSLNNRPGSGSGIEIISYGSKDMITNTPLPVPESETTQGLFAAVGNILYQVGGKIMGTSQIIAEKVKDMEVQNKLKTAGEITIHYAKITGSYVSEKGKRFYYDGMTLIVDKAKTILSKDQSAQHQVNDNHSPDAII